jgi:hypothetical protein
VKGFTTDGKQVHVLRLVALCQVHGITHILTFDVQHFVRFAGFVPGLAVIDPRTVTAPPA